MGFHAVVTMFVILGKQGAAVFFILFIYFLFLIRTTVWTIARAATEEAENLMLFTNTKKKGDFVR